ncbi:hypothetical protein [Sulfitobacter sp. JB4-11]|uniref:hypothetical protein n=1 Tax=Sulfitobacter rhodophyticola TaxID=3238304 RepID=UPI003D816C2F
MTTITQEQEIAEGTELLAALYAAVRSLRREIEALTARVQVDDAMKETDISRPMTDVRGLVTQCTKAEIFLNECRKKQAGIARGDYALDLDRARSEIGCKLDRLRRCSDAAPIS